MTTDWYQQQLTPPDVVECNVRLGVIPSTDHAQGLVELKDPVSGILIAQYAAPHVALGQWPHLLDLLFEKAAELLAATLEPF